MLTAYKRHQYIKCVPQYWRSETRPFIRQCIRQGSVSFAFGTPFCWSRGNSAESRLPLQEDFVDWDDEDWAWNLDLRRLSVAHRGWVGWCRMPFLCVPEKASQSQISKKVYIDVRSFFFFLQRLFLFLNTLRLKRRQYSWSIRLPKTSQIHRHCFVSWVLLTVGCLILANCIHLLHWVIGNWTTSSPGLCWFWMMTSPIPCIHVWTPELRTAARWRGWFDVPGWLHWRTETWISVIHHHL